MNTNRSLETYTLDEAAEELRVSRRFLQQEAKRGRLKVVRLSRKATRVRARDLNEYLNANAA